MLNRSPIKNKQKYSILDLFTTTYEFAEGKRAQLLFIYVAFILTNIIALSTIYISGKFFNFIQTEGITAESVGQAFLYVGWIFANSILFWMVHGPTRLVERKLAFYVANKMREYLYVNTLDLSLTFHNAEHSGQIISKINKASNSLETFGSHQFQVIRPIIDAISVVIVIFLFNFKLGIFAVLLLGFSYFINSRFEKVINPLRDKMNEKDNTISEIVFDTISNITTIKMLSLSTLVHRTLNKTIAEKFDLFKKDISLNEWKYFVPSLFSSVVTLSCLSFYIYESYALGVTIMIGSLYTLYGYLGKLGDVMESFAWLVGDRQNESRDIYNSKSLSDNFSLNKNADTSIARDFSSLTIQNLDFSYGESYNLEIDNLELEKGKTYAFVGESGCGKTTTLKILASLIELQKYDLLIDGKKENLSILKDVCMLIPQEPELFSSSVRENITLGLPFSQKEINEVVKMVNMSETIDELPEKFESKIFEKGVNLSGGQKQRLALARGIIFAKEKQVILFDEPTSSVDEEGESKIYDQLISMCKDKIMISTIHKKHLLSKFDYIVNFEKGRIKNVVENK